jgi:hypothetical protein
MNISQKIKRIAAGVSAGALVLALATGCASTAAQTADDSAAAQNRQYMATLNQQVSDISTATDSFQKAVADSDVVTMQAQVTAIDKTIDDIKNTDATDRLQAVKDDYVDALCTLDDAMKAYVQLYTDVQNGQVSDADYQQRLSDVQSAYNSGVEKMKAADDAVVKISNE